MRRRDGSLDSEKGFGNRVTLVVVQKNSDEREISRQGTT